MSSTELTIRRAVVADAGALFTLVESAYRGDASRAGWTTEAELLDGQRTDRAMIVDDIGDAANTGSRVYVAERGGAIIGCMNLQLTGDGDGDGVDDDDDDGNQTADPTDEYLVALAAGGGFAAGSFDAKCAKAVVEDLAASGDAGAVAALAAAAAASPASAVRPKGRACYFGMFAVNPTLQGGGVGSALMRESERVAAAEMKCTRMEMTIIDARVDLMAFYQRRGWQVGGAALALTTFNSVVSRSAHEHESHNQCVCTFICALQCTGVKKPFPYGQERFGKPKRDDLRFEVMVKPLAAE
jgi:GNAT superfamily N-acetyltransferase